MDISQISRMPSMPFRRLRKRLRGQWHALLRAALARLPEGLRFGAYRRMVECEPTSGGDLVLKIAETREELESCFALLHDAYVASGFMKPHRSGLRVTPYHALSTTTTLCAKLDGQVVGTLSIVRDGVFGFPMQTAFDISAVRAKPGHIAEISALAIHPRCRKTGGTILFPLMKFMYEYSTRYFDTRHLLIAVNPSKIEMYESLLFFQRLAAQKVDKYDFANGAPAIGATLDLQEAPGIFKRVYGHKSDRRNLYKYFVETRLDAIQFPNRPWHLSNDPVLTPALLDHFFNQRVPVLQELDERRQRLLHACYQGAEWQAVLPPLPQQGAELRRHPRYTFTCPATLDDTDNAVEARATIVEISQSGFLARLLHPLRPGSHCIVLAELGAGVLSRFEAELVRSVQTTSGLLFGFRVERPDGEWQRCVAWLDESARAAARNGV